jgi:hypothetical protein
MRHIFRDIVKRDVGLLFNGGPSAKKFFELILRLPSYMPLPFVSSDVKRSYYSRLLSLADSSFPLEIHIENTNVCDAECIMCPREKMTRKKGFMDVDFFCRIVDEIVSTWSIDNIHLHGFGEPLLDRSLPEKISYAKRKGIKDTYIVTTASQLTEEIAVKLIDSGLDRMKISISGASKESYEAIHRGLNYEKVEGNILRFLSIRKQTGKTNPKLIMQFLPQDENKSEEEHFFNKWEPLIDYQIGDRLTKFGLHNWVKGKTYRDFNVHALKRRSCGLPFRIMQILWNGDVVPCCYDFNGEMVLANLQECSVDRAWNSLSFKELRALHLARDFNEIGLCNACDQLDVL